MRTAGSIRIGTCALLVLYAAAGVSASGEYRTVEVEALRITVDTEWGSRTAPGYMPIRFDITNLGDPRVVEIVSQVSRFFRAGRASQGGRGDVRQVIRLGRGDRVRVTLPVPVYADNESFRLELREDGRTIERFSYASFQGKAPPAEAAVLIVADSATALGRIAAGLRRQYTPSHMMGTATTLPTRDFVLEPARLPDNWLGFTSLRAVMTGPGEWQQLGEGQRTAVLAWVAAGGDLLLVDGDIATLFPPGRVPGRVGEHQVRAYFFGRIHRLTSDELSAVGLDGVLKSADRAQDPDWSLPANRSSDWGVIAGRGFRLLIPGIDGVPARAYLSILILFALLIGPVNYWFLWRKGRQVLLVLTAPLISIVFIVLLGAYVIAGEGLSVYGRVVSFTMLDEVRKQAVTRATVSLYAAGMSPSGGLRFARDVAVFPVGRDGSGSRESYTLDLTDTQSFSSGIVQARSPTNFDQIVLRPARERLSFTREPDGRLSVVNGLGSPVAVLLYRVGGQTYRVPAPVADGERATLEIATGGLDGFVPVNVPLSARFRHLVANQPEGSYLALLEQSPFWAAGVLRTVERGSFHLVLGWPQGQP